MQSSKLIPVITIDGPSGTGKGTICYRLADHLNWHVLDSGSIYRVLAYAARKKAIDFNDINSMVNLAHHLNVKFETDPHLKCSVILDNNDVYKEVRSEQCGQDASKIAVIPEVREALLARQRAFAKLPGLVTDGRDMGTVVFPDAILKLYLYASAEVRANRRYLQLKESGIDVSLAEVINELKMRDERDTGRQHAPLMPAADAILIDTTGLTIVQVFNNVLKLVNKHPFFQ
ncbi:cytidylate kinase [Legionella beliardensis]|uniref:Cytidylate kinase n=1 Tax=Legionella beliardensis TaxID=91822 RepID=A0A378I164_9GAMM|nr:(d)CMP kinase [Legionella beliardensis]STX28947.1 cytidylate kinase [Legionella beliardensis]